MVDPPKRRRMDCATATRHPLMLRSRDGEDYRYNENDDHPFVRSENGDSGSQQVIITSVMYEATSDQNFAAMKDSHSNSSARIFNSNVYKDDRTDDYIERVPKSMPAGSHPTDVVPSVQQYVVEDESQCNGPSPPVASQLGSKNASTAPSHDQMNGTHIQEDEIHDLSLSSPTPSAIRTIEKIEAWFESIISDQLDALQPPSIENKTFMHLTQCRTVTSSILVASFCHALLRSRRTTTTREVYYFFVTHFRSQKECDAAIWDVSSILQVPRISLGLSASPKGWYCGCFDILNMDTGELILNGRQLDVHGLAITSSTLNLTRINDQQTAALSSSSSARIQSHDAKCILVIEKEGVYNRLSQDKFFLQYYPCILVTGKGFPDVATRQFVQRLQHSLHLPAYGLCDCNPFGISVLNTYHYDQKPTITVSGNNARRLGTKRQAARTKRTTGHVDQSRNSSPRSPNREKREPATPEMVEWPIKPKLDLKWIGLRPSQISSLDLPPTVLQQMTASDHRRLRSFLQPTSPFHHQKASYASNSMARDSHRMQELRLLEERNYKVELEALNWKGMDFLSRWLYSLLSRHDELGELQAQSEISKSNDHPSCTSLDQLANLII